MTKSKNINLPKHRWTDAEVQLLRKLYPDEVAAEVAKALNMSVFTVYNKANGLGLKKSPAFYASDKSARIQRGKQNPAMIATRIQPGHTPWNKGMKGLQIGGQATQFKPGCRPHTWVPVGSYRINSDRCLERKVNDLPGSNHVRWHPVSRLVWEAVNGPVPKGHMVVFKPGRRTTTLEEITIDRVECITRAENATRNHPRSKSPELGKLVQLRGAITRQINKRSRDNTPNQGATP